VAFSYVPSQDCTNGLQKEVGCDYLGKHQEGPFVANVDRLFERVLPKIHKHRLSFKFCLQARLMVVKNFGDVLPRL